MTDITRSGGRDYTEQEYRRVVDYVTTAGRVLGNDEIASALSIGGRTVRAILSDADGVEFVLSIGDAGIVIAGSVDESERGTARLRSQARNMNDRADRRERWAQTHLARVQARMW
jgi:malonyl CoA-acyl carrier protein transacylase